MPKQKRDPIEYLFNARKKVAPDQSEKVAPVKKMLPGTAFFPGGSGLWLGHSSSSKTVSNKPSMPKKKIMVLGNDFGLKAGYENAFDYPYENLKSPTWRNLLELLHHAGIKPKNCFFTNAYMGLRITGKRTGQSPGAADPEFVERCESFFLDKQIPVQKPRLILVLGTEARRFITPLSSDLKPWKKWQSFEKLDAHGFSFIEEVNFKNSAGQPTTVAALVHPSAQWTSTFKNRRYRGANGEKAELKMLKRALEKSGLKK